MWGFSWIEIGTCAMVLFAVIDMPGNIPIVIDLKQKTGKIKAEITSLVALGLMVGFLFLGEKILGVIGIDIGSFAIAGSFIIFFMALEMILGIHLFKHDAPQSASIVPLAFPVIAGAGTMTSLVSLRAEYELVNVIIAILVNMPVIYLILKLTSPIERILGQIGIAIMRKAFGIILLAIAVKLFRTNLGI